MRGAGGDLVAWTPVEKLHVTVKFLGEQPDDAPARLVAALGEVAARHQPLPLTVGGAGAFPNFRRARVLWVGIAPDARLELLHHDVEERCAAHGFELEGRPFRPHVTIGRVRDRCPEETARALSRAARGMQFRETTLASSIEIVESALGRAGATHTVLQSVPLITRAPGSWAASRD
jgi:RNA 2',3'-cyclic 3'-phosphodiesterase